MVQPVSTPESTPASAPPPPELSPRHAELLSSLLLLDHNLAHFAAENSLAAPDLLAFFRDPAVQSALADLRTAAIDLDIQHSLRLRRKALDHLEHILDTTEDAAEHLKVATTLARTTRPWRPARAPIPSDPAPRTPDPGEDSPLRRQSRPVEPFSSASSLFNFLCDVLPKATTAQALESIAPHLAPTATINDEPVTDHPRQALAPLLHDRKMVQVFLQNARYTDALASAQILCVAHMSRGSIFYSLTAAPDNTTSPPSWRLTAISRQDDKPNTS